MLLSTLPSFFLFRCSRIPSNMEDEVDIDIEGDDCEGVMSDMDGGGLVQELVQERLVSPAEKSESWILPWELDSSISPENREVIERMLLEEQYYLTGKEIPAHIWHSGTDKKRKVKKSSVKSAASASGSSTRWSKEEKELFEAGLTQFGRRWTKVAKLMESRTVLQVKSYARQYFKHKAKSAPKAAAPSAGPVLHLRPPQPTPSPAPSLANAVRIERLSDDEDEDVDITDDPNDEDKPQSLLSDPEEQIKTQSSTEEEETEAGLSGAESSHEMTDQHAYCRVCPQSPGPSSSLACSEGNCVAEQDEGVNKTAGDFPESLHTRVQTESKQMTESEDQSSEQADQLEDTPTFETDSADKTDINLIDCVKDEEEEEVEEEDDDSEEEELCAPEQEVEIDMETVTDDEKQAIPEFFEGRPSKTPERYVKIRNYILDQWLKIKPKYLNKTSVRPGLKNCGDVNCIGRIHTYLELIGAINFGCEQAVYNRPKVVDRSKHKEGKDVLEAYQLAQRLQNMRTRKRRVRDIWGNWCDAKDLEGQTYEHLSGEELVLRREEMKRQPKRSKMSRCRGSVDPFQLIPCRSFEDDVQEPFRVIVCAETLLIMDMHAHASRGEVIGLLGGTFSPDSKVLKICAAEPCNSVSTGLQCEMDPVSQTQACDMLSSLGLSVVGWYHSHPSFHPNPSVRDINTQDQFQSYFSRGGAPFIGMIVSPYDPANASPHSQTTCLLVRESQEPTRTHKLPYRFDFLSSQDIPDWEQTMRRAQWIVHKYAQTPGSVQMERLFRRDSHLTCLEKMLSSLARYLEPLPEHEGDHFLTQIQALFQTDFIFKQESSDQEEGDSSKPTVGSEDLGEDQLMESEERGGDAETSSTTVLHLGSVLSTEHDYLL